MGRNKIRATGTRESSEVLVLVRGSSRGLFSTSGLELEKGQAERKAWGDHKHQVR